jgi:hypothetical protein
LIGFVFDDFTTYILFFFGFAVLESNPIYQYLQDPILFIVVGISIYGFLFYSFYKVVEYYRINYAEKTKYFKIYDVILFMFCFVIIFFVVVKVMLGVNNLSMMALYTTTDGKINLQNHISDMHILKKTQPDIYKTKMTDYYSESLKINYLQSVLIAMLAYILFRTGNRVIPNDLD